MNLLQIHETAIFFVGRDNFRHDPEIDIGVVILKALDNHRGSSLNKTPASGRGSAVY